MALVKYGPTISSISGVLENQVFANNRYGNYIRGLGNPVNRNTVLQQRVRVGLSLASELWATITTNQRAAWEDYASAVTMQNRQGDEIHLSGFNHFVRSVCCQLEAGIALGSVVKAGPTTLSLPSPASTFGVSASVATQNLSITFTNTDSWATEAGGFMLVYMGKPQGAQIGFFDGPYRFAKKIIGANPTAPVSPQTGTVPFAVALAQKFWAYYRILRADGRVSNPFCTTGVVGA
jgi:hypothetical protein